MAGFFSASKASARTPIKLIADCDKCGLYRLCKSPKMQPSGKGRSRVLIVGDRPGLSEDKQGRQFVGGVGRYLADVIRKLGYDMREDCVLTNAVACFSGDEKANLAAVQHCRPNVIDAVKAHDPDVIIPLGRLAVKSLFSWLWREEPGEVGRWVGFQIPSQRLNAWVCPSWNPNYLLQSMAKGRVDPLLAREFERHLADALAIDSKPWKVVPDYRKKIELIFDSDSAESAIYEIAKNSREVAFDYETNMLKPDGKDARVYSCAVSNGTRTIAYPWHGKAIKATSDLLRSDVPKVGYNVKFEERWTMRVLGHPVNNWKRHNADGMINAHILDNRGGVTGLKFQAFVLFGVEPYDDEIKEFLVSDNPNTPNRIFQAPVEKILLYNGMDALLEYKVHQRQCKEMGESC